MIFSCKIGSKGAKEESFTLRIPFTIAPSRKVQISPRDICLQVGNFKTAIIQEEYFYALEIFGIPSEEAAYQLLPNVAAGFYLTTICNKTGILFAPLEPTPVSLNEKPILIKEKSMLYSQAVEKGWSEVDGTYDSDKTIIRPEHKRLFAFTMGRPEVVVGIKDSEICNRFTEAFELKNSKKAVEDKKMRLALEVYSSSFFESSDNAKFLTQVTVLEILKSDKNRVSKIECDSIDEILKHVKKKRNALDKEDSGYSFFNNLMDGIGRLKKQSIGESIQDLVLEKSKFISDVTDPVACRDRVKDVYSLRSSLVHNGSADKEEIKKAIHFLDEFIPQLLSVIFLEMAN